MAKSNDLGHAEPDDRMFKRGYLVNLVANKRKPAEQPTEKPSEKTGK